MKVTTIDLSCPLHSNPFAPIVGVTTGALVGGGCVWTVIIHSEKPIIGSAAFTSCPTVPSILRHEKIKAYST